MPLHRETLYSHPILNHPPDLILNHTTFHPIKLNYNEQPNDINHEAKIAAAIYSDLWSKQQLFLFEEVEFKHKIVELLVRSAFMKRDNANTVTALQNLLYKKALETSLFHGKAARLDAESTLTGTMAEASFYVAALQLGYDVYQSDAIWDIAQGTDFFVIKDRKFLEVDIKSDSGEQSSIFGFKNAYMQIVAPPKQKKKSTYTLTYDFPYDKSKDTAFFNSISDQLRQGLQATEVTVNLLQPPSDPSLSSHMAPYYSLRRQEAGASESQSGHTE